MNERIKEFKRQAIKLVAESYTCDIEDFTDVLDQRVRAKVDAKFAELVWQEAYDEGYNAGAEDSILKERG